MNYNAEVISHKLNMTRNLIKINLKTRIIMH